MVKALRVALRADVSIGTGTGHLRRCLSLAEALQRDGSNIVFIARPQDRPFMAGVHHPIHWLTSSPTDPQDDATQCASALEAWMPDWVVVDHYELDTCWHSVVRRQLSTRVLALDDLADRAMAADLLINHNVDGDLAAKYQGLLTTGAPRLFGPRFALLHPDYADAQRYRFSEAVRSIGIFMGGSDPGNACSAALEVCRTGAGFEGNVEVVSSRLSPHIDSLSALCQRWPRTRLLTDLPDLRDFFARHDLQIGAGGGAALERCCMGVPTIALALAENQLASLRGLSALGAVILVNDDGVDDDKSMQTWVEKLILDVGARRLLSERAITLVDGRGAGRVAAVMQVAGGAALTARRATADDEVLLLGWANEPITRANAFNPAVVTAEEHSRWFASRLADEQGCRFFILQTPSKVPVAQVRLDRLAGGWQINYSVDIAFRGWRLGRRALALVIDQLSQESPQELTARVMLHNQSSVRIFEQLGFACQTVSDHRGDHLLFRLALQP